MSARRILVTLWRAAWLAAVIGSGASPVVAQSKPTGDEAPKDVVQTVLLNGQVKDNDAILRKVATRYSEGRLVLVVFGDPSNPAVQEFKTKSLAMLEKLARTGDKTALLHIDTTVYKTGPAEMLDADARPFVDPSALVYVDRLQASYVRKLNDEELDFIEKAMVVLKHRFMGWDR